ncbi:MAG: glutamine amidotransferase [Chloroflexaceae bacterium]|nr:glutamine amidotransferase [Chloroflexaceae bacterium]
MTEAQWTLKLAYLYPDQMNIYGDRGNIIALQQRCAWRGIALEIESVDVGSRVDWSSCDLAFFGGGQDSGQALIAEDFLREQREPLTQAIETGLVMLAICGGYQLLGHYFLTHTGERLPGAGILDVHTVGGKKRLIGNIVVETTRQQIPTCREERLQLVGFENHSGRTYHGAGVTSLGRVIVGYGDNGEDGRAGAMYRNVIGCYLHGSLLPKNPQLADHLLLLALQRRYGTSAVLPALDDRLELQAQDTMVQRLRG